MKAQIFSLLFGLVTLAAGLAQAGETILPGSREWNEIFEPPYKEPTEVPSSSLLRKTLFDQLRPNIVRQAGKPVRFMGSLTAFKNWALFVGRTVNESGDSIRFPPLDNDDTVALWLRTRDGWRLVDFSVGHSDAFYIIWPEQYGVPKTLLGMK